jgi:anti-anti-sigma factor
VFVRRDEAGTLVELFGEVDLANVEEVSRALRTAIDRADGPVLVDLSQTTYLDSAGIRLLFEAVRRSHGAGTTLRLVVPPASLLRRALDVVDLQRFVPLYASRDDARSAEASFSP